MINLLKLLHLLTLFYISDALSKRQNSLVRSNRLYGESTVLVALVNGQELLSQLSDIFNRRDILWKRNRTYECLSLVCNSQKHFYTINVPLPKSNIRGVSQNKPECLNISEIKTHFIKTKGEF